MIWYNSLFFCGFFGDGLFYTIEYTKMRSQILNESNYRPCLKTWFSLAGITWLVTFIICVLFNATAMNGLCYLYANNQAEPISTQGGEFLNLPNAVTIRNFLWSTDNVNLQLVLAKAQVGNIYTPCYALMYLTLP